MKWNWEKPNWTQWEFNAEELQKYETEFLLQAGKLSGALEHLLDDEKRSIHINLLSDEAMTTSKIEWEYLDRESVQSSIKRKFGIKTHINPKPAENGIAELMLDCFENYKRQLTHEVLFSWHRMICSGRRDLHVIGGYRTHSEAMQVVSGEIDRPKIHFEAPASSRVYDEMEQFLSWLQDSKLPILTKAWIAHLYFVSIHPFEDGNGRISRALCEYIFSQSLGIPSMTILSRQIEIKKKEYYLMLERNNKTMEISSWIVWFSQTVIEAQKYALTVVDFTIAKTKMLDSLAWNINERQKKVLLRLFAVGPEWFLGWLSAGNYIALTKTSIPTATRDLLDLVNKWVLKRTGERKTTRYWLHI